MNLHYPCNFWRFIIQRFVKRLSVEISHIAPFKTVVKINILSLLYFTLFSLNVIFFLKTKK